MEFPGRRAKGAPLGTKVRGSSEASRPQSTSTWLAATAGLPSSRAPVYGTEKTSMLDEKQCHVGTWGMLPLSVVRGPQPNWHCSHALWMFRSSSSSSSCRQKFAWKTNFMPLRYLCLCSGLLVGAVYIMTFFPTSLVSGLQTWVLNKLLLLWEDTHIPYIAMCLMTRQDFCHFWGSSWKKLYKFTQEC